MRVQVTAVCTATVEERWVLEIPDDAQVDLLGDDLFTLGEMVAVENVEVFDERDREVTSVEKVE